MKTILSKLFSKLKSRGQGKNREDLNKGSDNVILKCALPGHPLYAFMHIFKTAGTTFGNSIWDKMTPWEFKLNVQLPEENITLLNLWSHRLIHEHSKELGNDYKKDFQTVRGHFGPALDLQALSGLPVRYFYFLREPVDRAISVHAYNQRIETKTMPGSKEWSLSEFIRHKPVLASNYQVRLLSGDENLNPEKFHSTCADDWPVTREHLEAAKDFIRQKTDFAGIVEKFDASLVMFRYLTGLPLSSLVYKSENVSPDRMKATGLPEDQIRALVEMNQLDLELYDFAVGIFDEKWKALGQMAETDLAELQRLNLEGPRK